MKIIKRQLQITKEKCISPKERQKNTPNQTSEFRIKNLAEVNDQSRGTYNVNLTN